MEEVWYSVTSWVLFASARVGRTRINSRSPNLFNAVFKIFSDSFNTITFKMLALKVDDVGKGLRTGPESK